MEPTEDSVLTDEAHRPDSRDRLGLCIFGVRRGELCDGTKSVAERRRRHVVILLGRALYYTAPVLQADREVVLEAVKVNWLALQYVGVIFRLIERSLGWHLRFGFSM